jgi:hypothetical protein
MPTINSDIYAAQIGGLVRNRLDPSVVNAEARIAEITYVTKATELTADIIKLWQIPPGVVIYAENIKVFSEGVGGTTVTITKIGDQAVDNRYSTTAIALTAAGIVVNTPVLASVLTRPVIVADVNDVLQITLGGTLPMTITKKIVIHVPYRLV